MPRISVALWIPLGYALLSPAAHAQFGRGANDWSTAGFDAQRSSWVRTDPKISVASLSKPGFAITWKISLKDKSPAPLGPAILMARYIGYRGFRSFAFLGGAGDNVYTVDTDLSRLEWHDHLAAAAALPSGCPASSVPQVVRPSAVAFPAAPQGRGGGGGRGGPAHSGVGEAGEGAVTLAQVSAAANVFPGAPAAPGRGGRGEAGRGGPGGFDMTAGRKIQNSLYLLTSDGMLHSVWLSSGEKSDDPVKFLPPGAGARGLILVDNVAYAATSSACGGSSGITALNVATKQATAWNAGPGAVAGEAGPAFGPDGTLYVSRAGSSPGIVALEAKTLQQKDWYGSNGVDPASSPVIFQYKDQTLLAVTAKDRKIILLDTKSLGGADHQTALLTASVDAVPPALSSWQDASGTRWLSGAADGAVRAWKIVDKNGAPALESGWNSRDIAEPVTPLIVNGVVFAASRGTRSSPAVLYALDSATGKELWNSGKTISSSIAEGGLSAGDTQVFVSTADGTLYAFGFPIEH